MLTLEATHLTLCSWFVLVLLFNVCYDREPCERFSVIETH